MRLICASTSGTLGAYQGSFERPVSLDGWRGISYAPSHDFNGIAITGSVRLARGNEIAVRRDDPVHRPRCPCAVCLVKRVFSLGMRESVRDDRSGSWTEMKRDATRMVLINRS